MAHARWARLGLLLILALSLALRIQLARQGGQGYWPDEARYNASRSAVAAAHGGDWRAAGEHLLGSSDHIFFRFLGLLPASLERVLFPVDATPQGFAAAFFGLFGVGAIALVWLIARKECGDEATGTWCAFFYAACVMGFFFSRHFFPYDPALFLLLLGWWHGLRSTRPWQHWLTGLLVGLGYLTYNAYWNVGAIILVFHATRTRPLHAVVGRSLWAGLGLLTPIVAFIVAARLVGVDLVANAVAFSRTVTQGGFGGAWKYIPEYFLAAEGPYAALLVLLVGAGAIRGIRNSGTRAFWRFLAMGASLAMVMIFFSDVIERFALSGRMVKPLAVFLALTAGAGLGRLGLQRSRLRQLALATATVALTAPNFRMPLSLVFPRDFRLQIEPVIAAERARDPAAPLQLYYADFMHGAEFITNYPPHTVLRESPHPLQFRPYQFEGYDESTRRAFQTHDFAMRLVRLDRPVAWQRDWSRVGPDLHPYFGAIQFELTMPRYRPVGLSEPLVVAGGPGRADLLSLHYLDGERVELVMDHWGWGATRSLPFTLPANEGQRHHVIVCAGCLLPPDQHPTVRTDRDLQVLARQVVVVWDDQVVMRQVMPQYPTPSPGVTVGGNYVGGTSARLEFSGQVHAIKPIDPRLVMNGDWGLTSGRIEHAADLLYRPPLTLVFDGDPSLAKSLATESTVFAARRQGRLITLTARAVGERFVFSLWEGDQRLAESAPTALVAGANRLEAWAPFLGSDPARGTIPPTPFERWSQTHYLLWLNGKRLIDHPRASDAQGTRTGSESDGEYLTIGRVWPLEADHRFAPFPAALRPAPAAAAPAEATLLRASWQDRLVGQPVFKSAVGPLRLKIRLPEGRVGTREPLLASGVAGAADLLFVSYDRAGTVRLGHDHWGWELLWSDPVSLPADRVITVDISLGSLFPRGPSPAEPGNQLASRWVARAYLAVDGRTVLDASRESYPADPATIVAGLNLVGASTSGPEFTGEILSIEFLDPAVLPAAARRD